MVFWQRKFLTHAVHQKTANRCMVGHLQWSSLKEQYRFYAEQADEVGCTKQVRKSNKICVGKQVDKESEKAQS